MSSAQINFQDEALALGIGITSGSAFLGNGLSLVDFDNDGFDDITLATDNGQDLRFFKNVNGSFVEQILNIPSINYRTKSVNWVDIDNDGDKDFFATANGLTLDTLYDLRVQSNCGSGDLSSWSAPFSFNAGYCIPSGPDTRTYIDNFSTTGEQLIYLT